MREWWKVFAPTAVGAKLKNQETGVLNDVINGVYAATTV
jgi:hypothetical protein